MIIDSLCRDCDWSGQDPQGRCPRCGSPRLVTHPELASLGIAHLDCDAFYASVEKRDRPELRDKPVIVGGGSRGVVTTACYIARLSGVRSAMPMFKARALCPDATIISPDFSKYRKESRRIMSRLSILTPLIQPLSLDEAWLDLTGSDRLHGGPPALTISRVQRAIEADIGLTVSIGLAPNKFLAKIASDLDKPRGFAVIGECEAAAFLAPRPVSILPGVGPVFSTTLEKAGFSSVGDLAAAEPSELYKHFGSQGLRLSQLCRGLDMRRVDPDQTRKSITAETTFAVDLYRIEDLEAQLGPLCERVARQARMSAVAGRVVTLKLRTIDFRITTRRRTLSAPCQTAKTLYAKAREILRTEVRGRTYRLVGIGLSDLVAEDATANDLFAHNEARTLRAERTLDTIRARYGANAVVSARQLK